MIKLFLDNINTLHILEDGNDKVKYIEFEHWSDENYVKYLGNLDTLEGVSEYHLNELEEYDVKDFKEFAETEDGFITDTLLKECTVDELIEEIRNNR